uniref:Annexin n=1 Tax=Steinernema glaseri TaxID=37863 RepID=A0A1I8A039_9BILA
MREGETSVILSLLCSKITLRSSKKEGVVASSFRLVTVVFRTLDMDQLSTDLIEEFRSYLPPVDVATTAKVASRSPGLENWSAEAEDELEKRFLLDVCVGVQNSNGEPKVMLSLKKILPDGGEEGRDSQHYNRKGPLLWFQSAVVGSGHSSRISLRSLKERRLQCQRLAPKTPHEGGRRVFSFRVSRSQNIVGRQFCPQNLNGAEVHVTRNSPFSTKYSKGCLFTFATRAHRATGIWSFKTAHAGPAPECLLVAMKGLLLVSLCLVLLCVDAQWWGYGYYPWIGYGMGYGGGWYDPFYGGWYGKKKRAVDNTPQGRPGGGRAARNR